MSHQKEGEIKVTTANNNNNSNSVLLQQQQQQQPFVCLTTDEFLCRHLFSFLSTNNVTNLGMTCRKLHDIVDSSRILSYPCIVWEERRPTRIGYKDMRDDFNDNADVAPDMRIACVSQLQPFRFIFQTAEKESIQAEITLINAVWDEQDNMRDGRQCRRRRAWNIEDEDFPLPTRPFISIMRPGKKNQKYRRLLVLKPTRYYLDVHWRDQSYVWDDDWRSHSLEDIENGMNIIWKCAQRIAVYPDGIAYPSAAYLMYTLPIEPPPTALVTIDQDGSDRETVVEFSYRPARSLAEWTAILPGRNEELREYELHELPWYRKGYAWFSDDEDDDSNSSEQEEHHPAKRTKTEI